MLTRYLLMYVAASRYKLKQSYFTDKTVLNSHHPSMDLPLLQRVFLATRLHSSGKLFHRSDTVLQVSALVGGGHNTHKE